MQSPPGRAPVATGTGAAPAPANGLPEIVGAWAAHRERGVIFDFNGTLSHDEPLLLQVYTELFREHLGWALTPAEYYARLAGRSDREIVETAVVERTGRDRVLDLDLASELMRQRRERYQRLAAEATPILPGAATLVRRLADEQVALAIVTGAERPDVEFVLSRSPIAGLIPLIITEEDVPRGKPHPDGFLAGVRGLGLPTAAVLAFEDSLPGVRAAKAAGLRCVAVTGTHDADVLAPLADAVVPALGPELLEPGPPAREQAGR